MSVCKRRGVWTLDFRDQTGTRRWIQTKWSEDKDKPKADMLLAQYEAQIDDGRFEAKSDQHNFGQLVDAYLAQLDVRAFTRKDYESVINTHLKVYFNVMKLRVITPREVESFRAWMQKRKHARGDKPLAVRTTNKCLTTLSQMLNYAEGHGWVRSNPCNHVKKLKSSIDYKRKKLDGNILTWAECERLLDATGTLRDRALFRMAIETGMRQGELLGLRWTDIDWASGRVFVRNSCRMRQDSPVKTAASLRPIRLTKTLLRELRVWRAACPKAKPESKIQDLVFPNEAGGFEDAHNLVRRGLYPALRRSGLRQVRFHDLRHTCASLLLAAGVGVKEVQAHLGHASAQVTLDVYGHLIPGGSSAGADAFDVLASGSKTVAEPAEEAAAGTLTHGSGNVPEAVRAGSNVVAGRFAG